VRLFISLKELDLRSVPFSVALQAREIDFGDRVRQVGPLEATGEAVLQNATIEEIRVRGQLRVQMESDCDRCLEPAGFVIDGEFDLSYLPERLAGGERREEFALREDESDVAFYSGDGIELKDVLREHVLLSIPMRRLCREDCKGICPECGANRNVSSCGCELKLGDDRWAALREQEARSKK
jgi:uncharacterized protein